MDHRAFVYPFVLSLCFIGVSHAHADLFAKPGTPAELILNIKVTGARNSSNNSGEYANWVADHSATITIKLAAVEPVDVDPLEKGAMDARQNQYDQAYEQSGAETVADNNAVLDDYEARIDACGDDENCMMQVAAAMMSDPAAKQQLGAMKGAADMLMGADASIRRTPFIQTWAHADMTLPGGSIKVDQKESWQLKDAQVWQGTDVAAGGMDIVQGQVMPIVTINKNTSSYRIRLLDNFRVPAQRLVTRQNTMSEAIGVLGEKPLNGEEWDELLTVSGPISGNDWKSLGGSKSFKSVLRSKDAFQQDRVVDVTIEWQLNRK